MNRRAGAIRIALVLAGLWGWGLPGSPALAAELVIAQANPISSADPLFSDLAGNNGLARHIFDALTFVDPRRQLQPGLAKSWNALSDTEWEFHLRQGVQFHDGGPFGAEDVVFSINRASRVPRSPAPFTRHVSGISGTTIVNPHTLRIRTHRPQPVLPRQLSHIAILSRAAAGGKTTEELDQAGGVVGTGPYRFVRWEEGRSAVLSPNKTYWGPAEPWDAVVLRPVPDQRQRIAALTGGTAHLVDHLSAQGLEGLRKARDLAVFQGISSTVFLLHLDSGREQSPFVVPGKKNPLRDVEVRQAISLAINRGDLVRKRLKGMGFPAGQILPPGFSGNDPKLKPDPYHPARAKRLLARAGLRRGFALTLHGPETPQLDSAGLLKELARTLGRVGIKAEPVLMPRPVFFPRAARREFSAMVVPWSGTTGEGASLLALLGTPDGRGRGGANWGGYSNPRLDALLAQALGTMADGPRGRLLREVQALAIQEYGVIPLFFETANWGAAKGVVYTPRGDGQTLAMQARPGP